MNFDNLLNEYRQKFSAAGSFILRRNDNLRETLSRNQVPSDWGVYLVYCDGIKECLYIGKGGGPGIQRPGIFERLLKGKHSSRIPLRVWFQNLMGDYNTNNLRFEWIITIDAQGRRVDPVTIRDELIRAHEDTFGRPPLESGQGY